jgi:hypothetical protein
LLADDLTARLLLAGAAGTPVTPPPTTLPTPTRLALGTLEC